MWRNGTRMAAGPRPEPSSQLYRHVLPAGRAWSGLVRTGETLRIVDLMGEQAVDTLLYRGDDPAEHYDAQITVLSQTGPIVTRGTRLFSNRGRVMMTVVTDTLGGHDTLAGCCSTESNAIRYGEEARHLHACRENFLTELARYGLSKRDIVGNLNFFMKVPVEEDGSLAIVDGVNDPGHYVDLRAEMDVLCVISNCPQINNPCNGFDPTPIEVMILSPDVDRRVRL
jgi:urea carboxylase-associated protein 1